jgi:oxygen-independent coproporphyrinogen III oxidase
MMEAIVKEIRLGTSQTAGVGSEIISTVYLGGGTPSILDTGDIQMLFNALKERFSLSTDTEITLEANPDDISISKLQEWRSVGINRLSVGIQSFNDDELKWMNRAHTAAESLASIDMIKVAGFDNFSVDLIYGSPVLTDDDWKKNVDAVIEKCIPHISCYALTVEPKTALHKMIALHKKEPVDAEKQARQFLLLMDWLQEAGYEHYEISNFARRGFRSKHNSSYWSGEPYYAFGPAAHSFDGRARKWNIANNAAYIRSLEQDRILSEEEILTETQRLNEYIMTSLRTIEGLDLQYVTDKFGKEKSEGIELGSKKFESTGKLKFYDRNIVLTKEGKLFADGIAADLFF